jgi:tetratricopeptide (TPR) repeat protein
MLSQEHTATRQLLADLPPEQRRALVHLLSCGSCQRLAANRLIVEPLARGRAGSVKKAAGRRETELAVTTAGDSGGSRVPLLEEVAGPYVSLGPERSLASWPLGEPGKPPNAETQVEALMRELASTDVEALVAASELVHDLLELPPAARRREVAAKAAFGDPQVIWLLIYEAEAGGATGERGAAELAELAVGLAERQPPLPHAHVGPLLVAALLAAAREWTRLGQELRAEVHYARLAALLSPAAIQGWVQERARLCEGLAQLRWLQGRLDEAATLFQRAIHLLLVDQDERSAAFARAQLGLVLLESETGDGMISARRNLQAAHVQLASELPALRARVVLALAFCVTVAGEGEAGATLLKDGAVIANLALPPDSSEALVERWWRARIAAVGGQAEEAARELDALRIDLLGRGSLGEAASVTVDLVEVSAGLARKIPRGLADDLVSAFGEAGAEAFALRVREVEALPGERLRQVAVPLIAGLRSEAWRLRGPAAGRPRAIRGFPDLVDAARAGFE